VIRLLHIINTLQNGGAELLLLQTLKGLNKKIFSPAVCSVFGGNDLVPLFKNEHIPVFDLGLKHRSEILIGVSRLRRILIRNRIDILHTHLFEASILGRVSAKLSGRTKIITTQHNMFENNQRLTCQVRKWMDKKTSRWNCAHVAVSAAVKDDIKRNLCVPHAIEVIYNGVLPRTFDKSKVEMRLQIRNEIGIPHDAFVFSNVGRLHEEKGHEYLIRAFNALRKRYTYAVLIIAGDGPNIEALKKLALDFNLLGKHLFFLGRVEDPYPILMSSDVFVIPSIYEGFGMAAIEAMQVGIPVIASDTGGLREIIMKDNNGQLVPPRDVQALTDAMQQLIENDELRSRYSQSGPKTVEKHFLLHQNIEKLERLYLSVSSCSKLISERNERAVFP